MWTEWRHDVSDELLKDPSMAFPLNPHSSSDRVTVQNKDRLKGLMKEVNRLRT